MIDAIQDSIPLPAGVEAGVNSGSKSAPAGFSFTDTLGALVGGGKVAAASAEADPKQSKTDDASVALMGLAGAGAMQMASVVPLQADPTTSTLVQNMIVDGLSDETNTAQQTVVGENQPSIVAMTPAASEPEIPVASFDKLRMPGSAQQTVVGANQPSISSLTPAASADKLRMTDSAQQTVVGVNQPSSAAMTPAASEAEMPVASFDKLRMQSSGQQTVVGVNQPPIAAPTPDGLDLVTATVEVQLVQAETEPGPKNASSVSVSDQPVVPGQSTPDSKPAQTASSPQAVVAPVQSGVPLQISSPRQANAPVDQKTGVDDEAKPTNTQVDKSEKSIMLGAAETSIAAASASRVPMEAEAVTVRWQFDGSSRAPQGDSRLQIADLGLNPQSGISKQSSGENRSSTGQESPNPQAAMGMQFTTQLREAVQGTAPAASAPDLHVRVIEQVVQQVKLQQFDGGSNLVVKLNPPDLGALRLQITQDATGMTTHIQASNSHVRGLLEAHMPLLMDSLSRAGVQMDSVSVSVGTSFNAFAQNARQQDSQPNSYQSRQAFATGRETGGIQTIAEAAMRPTMGNSRQAGYSWLA